MTEATEHSLGKKALAAVTVLARSASGDRARFCTDCLAGLAATFEVSIAFVARFEEASQTRLDTELM